MIRRIFLYLFFCIFFVSACQTSSKQKSQPTLKQQLDDIESVAEAITGQDVDQKALVKELRKNPEAKSAMQSIAEGMQKPSVIKYSPTTGKHFAPHLDYDPVTGEKLEELEVE